MPHLAPVYKSSELKKLPDGVYEFVASDETPDRYGDVVRVAGWELKNYRSNPIVLFGHSHSTPIGKSLRVWTEGRQLLSRIKLADEGTSPFIDTLRKLMDQEIIRAVSVGFMPTVEPNYIRDEKNDRITGLEFVGQELTEISLVTVPANPKALEVARSLGVGQDHLARIFSPQAKGASARTMAMQRAALDLARLGAPSSRF